MKSSKVTAFVLIMLIFLVANANMGTNATKSSPSITPSNVSRDYWPTEGWQTASPEEHGMDSALLQDMIDYIDNQDISIDSVIVIRNGYIVLEEYPNPLHHANRSHLWFSVTKSFSSSLIGIALDKGYIDNVSQKVLSFFPDRNITNWDERKERITLEHLLTMRAGLFWDEWNAPFGSPENGIYHLIYSDGVQFVLESDMVSEPGEEWHYNTGASHLLSAIVQQTSGVTTLEFGREHLFEPLGITNVFWPDDAAGVTRGGFDLSLRPLDAAKFGYLFLNNGTWDDEQIISSDWVNKSTSTFTMLDPITGYGYQWWTNPAFDYYYAAGLYGQYIFVKPEEDLVVVFSSNIREGEYPHEQLLQEYILASITDATQQETSFDPFVTLVLIAIVVPIIIIALYWVHKSKRQ